MNKSFLAFFILKRINRFIRIGMILAEILIYLLEEKLQHWYSHLTRMRFAKRVNFKHLLLLTFADRNIDTKVHKQVDRQ